MDINLKTTYYNCSFSLSDLNLDENGVYECVLNFNAGWLSCSRPFFFTKNNGKKFVKKLNKLDVPFGSIAVLESTSKNMKVQMECIAPGTIMISAEGFDDSEFEQEERLGFNINKDMLNELSVQLYDLLA